MTEREKDEWILAQVKIMPEDKLEDVYKSLTGINWYQKDNQHARP